MDFYIQLMMTYLQVKYENQLLANQKLVILDGFISTSSVSHVHTSYL